MSFGSLCLTRIVSRRLWPSFTSMRYKGNAMFDVFPTAKLFKVVDSNKILVKYSKLEELNSAPEIVKKVLSVEFGYVEDFLDQAVQELVALIDPDKNAIDEVTNIVSLTVKIKHLDESYKRTNNIISYRQTIGLTKTRTSLLDNLRDTQFEVYAKTVKILDLHHYFEPQYPFVGTKIADEVRDMRIRAYAESKRLAALETKRKNQLSELKEKYKLDITSKTLQDL